MQSTGHAGRHLSHPEQSSGMITTSGPWLKMAPKWLGQWRRQASQLMHSAISMRSGGFFHFGLRSARGDPLETGAGHDEPRARGRRD